MRSLTEAYRLVSIVLAAVLGVAVLASPITSLESRVADADQVEVALDLGVFSDIADSRFREDIAWLAAAGITSGCAKDRFCPDGFVTRGQMASFLVRALGLPATDVDAFADDDSSRHHVAINRLAAAGITSGCAKDRFCPDGAVTRGQLAALLRRGSNTDARLAAPSAPSPTPKPAGSLAPTEPRSPSTSTDPSASAAPTSTPITTTSPTPSPTQKSTPAPTPVPSAPSVPVDSIRVGELLVSRERLMSLPTSGAAWDALVTAANGFSGVQLANQDDDGNVRLLAWALVTVRTGGDVGPIHAALARVPGTEAGGRTLALGRNLAAVVLAADLVGYRDSGFVAWLRDVRHADLDGRTLIGTHEERPNNWGTHAGASRIAAALYLGDGTDLARAASVFRGWLGERSAYAGFKYGDLDWQADPARPVGINPAGARIDGHDVDGVLPDDQRRSGGFSWPPSKENYVYEALQGALLQAELLHRAGYPAYGWADAALGRAYRWLHAVAAFPAEGDDTWQIPLVNARYGTSYPAPSLTRHGKNFGFTDWLHR